MKGTFALYWMIYWGLPKQNSNVSSCNLVRATRVLYTVVYVLKHSRFTPVTLHMTFSRDIQQVICRYIPRRHAFSFETRAENFEKSGEKTSRLARRLLRVESDKQDCPNGSLSLWINYKWNISANDLENLIFTFPSRNLGVGPVRFWQVGPTFGVTLLV